MFPQGKGIKWGGRGENERELQHIDFTVVLWQPKTESGGCPGGSLLRSQGSASDAPTPRVLSVIGDGVGVSAQSREDCPEGFGISSEKETS